MRRHALESLAYSGEIAMRQLIEDAYYAPEEEMRISASTPWAAAGGRTLAQPDPGRVGPRFAMLRRVTASGALENRAAVPDLTDLLADDVAEVEAGRHCRAGPDRRQRGVSLRPCV
ncbi:MAG: hypothetical protein R3A10_15955 [Caldilineaceae bacterium]